MQGAVAGVAIKAVATSEVKDLAGMVCSFISPLCLSTWRVSQQGLRRARNQLPVSDRLSHSNIVGLSAPVQTCHLYIFSAGLHWKQ